MTTQTPIIGAPDWAAAQASPWVPHNQATRMIETMARRGIIETRGDTAPPGTCADGACYLIKATATGAWAGFDGQLAVSVGVNAASGWYFIVVATQGSELYIRDENSCIRYDGTTWQPVDGAPLTAGEAISAGQFVNIYASLGAKCRKANATDNTKPCDGYAPAAISNAAVGGIICPGRAIGGLSGLTPGSVYYLDTTGGGITATAPSSAGNFVQRVGVAISATQLFFLPQSGITL